MKIAKKKLFLKHLNTVFDLSVSNHSHTNTVPNTKQWRQWIWQTCKNEYYYANIAVILYDEEAARELNFNYRQKNYATNVLSFALNEGESVLISKKNELNGDLIFCPQVIEREAAEQNKSLLAHYAHLTIHGVLHLMGYDHMNDEEAEIMEELEIRIMHQLGYANPYTQDEY